MPTQTPSLSVCGIARLGTINTVSCHRLNNEWDIDTDQHPQAPSIPSGWRERERERKKNPKQNREAEAGKHRREARNQEVVTQAEPRRWRTNCQTDNRKHTRLEPTERIRWCLSAPLHTWPLAVKRTQGNRSSLLTLVRAMWLIRKNRYN